MTDPAPFTDPCLHIYRPVPAAGAGVCRVCRSGPGAGSDICTSCLVTMDQVSSPTASVVPVSLYRAPGPLAQVLRQYKDGPPPWRALFTLHLAAILATFTARHMGCLAGPLGGRPDLVATVPTTRDRQRPGRHPLETAVAAARPLAGLHAPLLNPGPADVGHSRADDEAFTTSGRLSGERVLLIDDTFTTGARAQSAASALRAGGASAVTVLTIGRVIWPDWNDNCRRIWDRSRERPFSLDVCCLCEPA